MARPAHRLTSALGYTAKGVESAKPSPSPKDRFPFFEERADPFLVVIAVVHSSPHSLEAFESFGGEWLSLGQQSIQSVALNGQVNFIGRLSDAASKIDINLLYNSVTTLRVIFVGNRAQFIAMNRAIAVNRLKPIIDRVFPFEQVIEAFH